MNRLDVYLSEHAGEVGPEVCFAIHRNSRGEPAALEVACLHCGKAFVMFTAREVAASRRAGVGERLRAATAS